MRRIWLEAACLALAGAACWAVPPAQAAPVRCAGHVATIVGTGAGDIIQGTDRADVIVGLGGNDRIAGGGGDDWVCGSRGSDRLSGGAGNDHLFGGLDAVHVTDEGSTERDGDALAGGPGNDWLAPGGDVRPADDVIHDSISWASSARGVHVDVAARVATGQGRDVVGRGPAWMVGSSHADLLEGSTRADLLNGGGGPDRIDGHGGDDRIVTDPVGRRGIGADVAFGGAGDDQISAAGGRDLLFGGPGDDTLDHAGTAAEHLYGGRGADLLVTQLAQDAGRTQVVDGGPGTRDVVDLHTQAINPSGLASTATWDMSTGRLVFRLAEPVVSQVVHVERVDLSAWGTTWTVRGTSRDDDLTASGSRGTAFTALGGDDTFWGSAYDDTFAGGPGTDHSRGMGDGTDTCSSVEVMDVADCEIITP